MSRSLDRTLVLAIPLALLIGGCEDACVPTPVDHGPISEVAVGPIGAPGAWVSDEQLEAFERGRAVAKKRFDRKDGLGPAFNVTFCAACHEKPVTGGSAGLYRNFFLTGVLTEQGAFFPGESAGPSGGVVRMYAYSDEEPARPRVPDETNVIAQRNPIPFFGVGLLAELSEEEILKRADPDDDDGDGISGRPNYDRGFVGRFGRKAQTVSIEGFIRGPLFNHLGVTTDPLSEEQRARLPVDSSGGGVRGAVRLLGDALFAWAQAAAPDGPLTDDDGIPDPELGTVELFDLVSFSMLLAAPKPEPLNDERRQGLQVFDAIGCQKCHTPRLLGPKGALPVYSDLLLHDMGRDLDDGLPQGDAETYEFRTQPLWGLSAVGPYLHDGRASTVEEAILWHGGEAEPARDRFASLPRDEKAALVEFLLSLGGRDQRSEGLLPPGEPIPSVGEYGGPVRALLADEEEAFLAGRALFDRDLGRSEGVGAPRFNGDSCRACHFDPVIGGAGPRGVNVIRHGILGEDGTFTSPAVGTVLHKSTTLFEDANRPEQEANVFEHRQTPHLFGLGLIDGVADDDIIARADPDDLDGDGISGRVSRTGDGRIGRFGWKAQVPSLAEFVRDASGTELGITLPAQEGLTFGNTHDDDDVADPELTLDDAELMTAYLKLLGPPPRPHIDDAARALRGEQVFESVGCARCHVPELPGRDDPVPLYSDLLLHEVLPDGAAGIEDTSASMREFRTAPLWGVRHTAPYLHSGAADTLDEAIRGHDAEAAGARDAYRALDPVDAEALLYFLGTL